VHCNLEIALRSDFAGLFEVKSHNFVRRGRIEAECDRERAEVRMTYTHKDFHRRLVYRLLDSGSTPHYANGRVTLEIRLGPGVVRHSCCCYILVRGEAILAPVYGCSHTHGHTGLDALHHRWKELATSLTSANEDIYRLYRPRCAVVCHHLRPRQFIQRGAQLLVREDPDVTEEITKVLREDEVEVLLGAHPQRVGGRPTARSVSR
jgi:hypothetical protein